jgi:hypothetical protein
MSDDDIHWEDPPNFYQGPNPGHLAAFVTQLQRHPGKWALYVNAGGKEWHGSGTVGQLRQKYRCQVRTSGLGRPETERPNMNRIWARWPEDAA